MSDKRQSLHSRRSFLSQPKPKVYLSRKPSLPNSAIMSLSQSPSAFTPATLPSSPTYLPPPGSKLPPGYVIPDGMPPLPEPPDPRPKNPGDFPARLSLELAPEEKEADLARICSDKLRELPLIVNVSEAFSVPGSDLKLEKGESLLLLFVAELPRVHAVDTTDDSELWLPVNAEQLYERLPLDPRLDDKLYMGVRKLMSARPMPTVVRVVEGYGSDDYSECVDMEDIVRLSHVEEKSSRHAGKVLIAQNQIGHRLELHSAMECAHFTTMLSTLFLYMSQLVDLEFPQRVRVVEETVFERRRPKEEKVLRLLSFKNDFQVIATRSREPRLLSIPINVPLKVQVAQFKERTVQDCLPALYSSVNVSWGPVEFGRPNLPEQFKEISQPLPEPLKSWLESYEGKERACEVAKVSKEDLVRDLKELKNYNKDLSDRIAFYAQPDKPEVPDRKNKKVPPRPPKPLVIRKTSTSSPDQTSPAAMTSPGKPKPKPRLPTSPSTKAKTPKKVVSKFIPSAPSRFDDGYEIPDAMAISDDEGNDGADYEEVPEIPAFPRKSESLDMTCSELKAILQQKEKAVAQLKEEKIELQQKCENLMKENESFKLTNASHVQEIHRLQSEIDRLVSKNDGDIYDTIGPRDRPLPSLPTSNSDSVIYNTPDRMLVEKTLMARTDVEGVGDILRHLGLSQYVDRFKNEGVDGALLVSLDDSVLKEDLGMTGLHARKLLLEVKKNK